MNTEGMQGRFDKKDTEKNIKRVNIKVIIIIIKSMVTVKRIDWVAYITRKDNYEIVRDYDGVDDKNVKIRLYTVLGLPILI